ncbi:hypothetical protein EV138_1095 [Kribbella voronezhensis]|uniref:DUF6875 domain-containing protein n=1 Tax=Kribbella voronezhensis TaxID=2512212 RepID=A0A4R7T6W6_9ACTN|nr:hypothetical protein [Kribbella voronezhensis]TDU87571.1 hypothetical protein EV138_1095 [Kribbella voronezhensis]
MRWRNGRYLWSIHDLETDTSGDSSIQTLQIVADWSQKFLVNGHPDLGRTGPVCPFTRPSIDRNLFYLACRETEASIEDLAEEVLEYKDWHAELAVSLNEKEKQLLTILVALPFFDPNNSTELDRLQAVLKDDFVTQGLMVGQFHPACEQPGLWNDGFRPLVAPVPLLAIRYMVPFDLPFLVGSPHHLEAYLAQFAPMIPSRVRDDLIKRLAG